MIKNPQRLSDRQDAEEVRALPDAGNYSIAVPYKRFSLQSSEWHEKKIRYFVPEKTNLFSKPRNSERKPCYQERPKLFGPDLIIVRHESNAN